MLASRPYPKSRSLVAALMVSSAIVAPILGVATPALAQDQVADQTYQFDIEADTLAAGIADIGRASGWNIAYTFNLPTIDETVQVKGSLTVPQAISHLLRGTELSYKVTADKSVILVDRTASATTADDGTVQLRPIDVEATQTSPNAVINTLPAPYAGNMVASGGRVGMLGNKDIMDTPFSTTSFTREKIENQQAGTVADVAKQDPSVRVSSSSGGMLDAYYIRGFPINIGNSSDIAFDGIYGVTPSYRIMSDLAERVEVVKGPTALIYGMAPNSAVGGTINIVPKRAGDEDLTAIKGTFGRGEQAGAHADVGRRFGENNEFGIRLNAGYSDGDTALDNQTRTARLGSAALDYRGEDFRATLDLINQREDFNAPSREVRLAAGVALPDAPNGARNITQAWEWSETEDNTALLRAEYDINDSLMVFGGLGGGISEVDRLFGYPVIQNSAGDTSDTPSRYVFKSYRWSSDAGIRVQFDTAAVNHSLTLQANYYGDRLKKGSANGVGLTSNIYDPINRPAQSVAKPSNIVTRSKNTITGVALADTLSVWDERVQLTLGARQQRVETDNFDANGAASDSYDESALSPMAGIVVKPWEHVSVYTNYAEGLSKGDIAPNTANNAGEALAPYVTKQYEAGVKLDFDTVATTASVFQITKPFGQLNAGNVYTSDGEQRNRGIELNVFGEVSPSIRLMAGAMFIDAEMTSTSSASTLGKTPVGVPDFQANVTAEWDTSFVDGLTLAGTVIHTGKQFVDAANTNSVDDWTTLDLAAYYDFEVGKTPLTVRGTVENVFDNEYWSGVNSWSMISQGAPRTFYVSLTSKF